jgi:hypothetical protein
MIDLLNAILDKTKHDEAKQWLLICLQEVRQSWKSYKDGNLTEGKSLIQQAEEHFDNAFSKRTMTPRFIAGEAGVASDSDGGFPA